MATPMSKQISAVQEEVHQVKGDVSDVKDQVTDVRAQVQELMEMKTQVTEIRNALLGTEFNEKNGLVRKVDDHERRLNDLENAGITSKMYFGVLRFLAVTIAAGVITGIIGLLFAVFKAINK